jgi:hypothetical protein
MIESSKEKLAINSLAALNPIKSLIRFQNEKQANLR